jgi:hypothetical protein
LWAYGNKLTSIDVTNNKKLRILDVSDNKLTSLNVSNNPDLLILDVTNNYFESKADINGLNEYNTTLYFDPQNTGFLDVETTDWFAGFVDFAVANKLMAGTGAHTFAPGAPATRAMLVTILYNYADKPAVPAENPFSDVEATAWYAGPIKWASANKVVAGYGDTFDPGANITREQIATVLYNYAKGYMGKDVSNSAALTFSDAGSISSYAVEPVKWCVANKLISGYPDGTFAPQAQATRAEVAAMLYNFVNNI